MPFGDGSFDTVIVADVIEHVASPRHTLKEIHRVLRPGGRMICVTPVRGVIHTLRFLDWIAASLARRGSSRLWWTNPQVYERFLSVREVEEAVRGAGFADRAHRRICFYPAPENHGTFGAFMHRLADRIGPGGFDRIADGWIRVFDLAARLGLANQKQLWEARK
jgi:ubiquinone/menaquinone biosynthesis C-methylase UbiE